MDPKRDDRKAGKSGGISRAPASDRSSPISQRRVFGCPAYRAAIVLIGCAGAAVRLWLIGGLHFMHEDALITLRYSRNLWQYGELTYNLGERVMGFTSPLWTLVLTPVGGLLGYRAAQIAATGLGLVLYGIAYVIALRLIERLHLPPASQVFVALFLAFHVMLVGESVSGMEMSLFLVIVLGSASFAIDDRKIAAFALASAGVLTRPEGAIWWASLFVFLLVTNRRHLVRTAIPVSAAIGLPWFIFAYFYYGTFIPQSAMSKSLWLAADSSAAATLWSPSQTLAMVLLMTGSAVWSAPTIIQIAILFGWLCLWACGAFVAWKRTDHVMLLFAGYSIAMISFYYLGRGLVFPWYAVVPNVLFAVVVSEVFDPLTSWVRGRARDPATGEMRTGFTRFVWTVTVAGVAIFIAVMAVRMPSWREPRKYEDSVLRSTGEYLKRCSEPDATVMLEPLGYAGYFSERKIYDLAGLVSAEFAPSPAKFEPGWGFDQVEKYLPDYVVLRRYEVRDNKFYAAFDKAMFGNTSDLDRFRGQYSVVEEYGEGDFGLQIFKRRNAPDLCD